MDERHMPEMSSPAWPHSADSESLDIEDACSTESIGKGVKLCLQELAWLDFSRDFGVVAPPAVQRLELQHTPMLVICSPININHDQFNHAQPALRLHVSLVSIQLVE
jgi:hypothetical protein